MRKKTSREELGTFRGAFRVHYDNWIALCFLYWLGILAGELSYFFGLDAPPISPFFRDRLFVWACMFGVFALASAVVLFIVGAFRFWYCRNR